MGIFSDIKLISLIKKVEGKYQSRLEEKRLDLNQSLSGNQTAPAHLVLSYKALFFAKKMNQFLFQSDSGVFKNDISKLNANNYELLYQIIIVWFSWVQIPLASESKRDQNSVNLSITHLKSVAHRLVNCAFYKSCMLSVGHIDRHFDTMLDNSPDCKEFIAELVLAIAESEKIFDKK